MSRNSHGFGNHYSIHDDSINVLTRSDQLGQMDLGNACSVTCHSRPSEVAWHGIMPSSGDHFGDQHGSFL